MFEKTDYITYDFLHSCILLCSAQGVHQKSGRSLEAFLSSVFFQSGFSLSAQRKVYARTMHQKKYLPLILPASSPFSGSYPLVLLPTACQNDAALCYINFFRIQSIRPLRAANDKKHCLVTFQDGLTLQTGLDGTLQRNYRKAAHYLAKLARSGPSGACFCLEQGFLKSRPQTGDAG